MIDNELVFSTFEQAAEKHGDITPLVYEYLFKHHPEIEELFLIKGEQFKSELMNKMVEDTIYSFLEYIDTPEEVEIVFKYTIPQHQDQDISLDSFVDLMEAVAYVVCNANDDKDNQEKVDASWNEMVEAFRAMVKRYTR